MVDNIRLAESALGSGKIEISKSSKENYNTRRSIYVSKNISKGEKITKHNIKIVRPGHGLHPKFYNYVLNKKSKINLKIGDRFKIKYVKKKLIFLPKDLKKFKENKALILENGRSVTYKNIITNSLKISRNLDTHKRLVFLLGQNNFETIIGYISFVNQGFAVALLDHRINDIFLKRLVSKYNPKYIFCKKGKLKRAFTNIINFKSYVLMKNTKKIDYNIDKDLMLLMSTSGSTGSPKLVKQSYQNISINCQSIIKYLKIKSRDITITTLPISYVYGLSVVNTHLLSGAQIVLTNRSMVENNFWKLIKNSRLIIFQACLIIIQ